jgi:hypothetical protein
MIFSMRSTIVLDDEVFKRAKQRAAELGTTLSDLVNQALRVALSAPPRPTTTFRMVAFGPKRPLVHHEPGDFAESNEDLGADT